MLGKHLLLSQFTSVPAPFQSLADVHVDTIVMSWACMGGILLTATLIRPLLVANGAGGKIQAVAEGLYTFVDGLASGQIGQRYKSFLPLIAGIFIFVLVGNFIGIAPWVALEHMPGWFHLPNGSPFEVASPTTDFNVTAGLACISLLTYLGAGVIAHRGKYLWQLLTNPIEWLDFIIRPSTLALRLMLVITADEVVRMVFLLMLPVLTPTAVMAFELFIAIIQAFVFALLTSIYIGIALSEEH